MFSKGPVRIQRCSYSTTLRPCCVNFQRISHRHAQRFRSPWNSKRSYAISVKPSVVYPGKENVKRHFDDRKTFLFNQYSNFLRDTLDCPLILLQHHNFTPQSFIKLRREIETASTNFAPTPAPSLATGDVHPKLPNKSNKIATLTVMRTSIFGVALRNHSPLDANEIKGISEMVKGGFAVLSLPSLHPPQLDAILKAFVRAAPPKKASSANSNEKPNPNAVPDDFVPGRRRKRVKPVLVPELSLVGAVIEGRVLKVDQVKDVAKLPTLETLRAQIVGLISAPAAQLARVLGEASGAQVARTLEGLKRALEAEQDGSKTEDGVQTSP